MCGAQQIPYQAVFATRLLLVHLVASSCVELCICHHTVYLLSRSCLRSSCHSNETGQLVHVIVIPALVAEFVSLPADILPLHAPLSPCLLFNHSFQPPL